MQEAAALVTPYMLLCARDPLSVGIWIVSDVVDCTYSNCESCFDTSYS